MVDADFKFFDDSDLSDVLKQLEEANSALQEEEDEEMTASRRRYDEIIKKHRHEGKGNQ